MKTKLSKQQAINSISQEGAPLTQEQLEAEIKKAEKSPFHSIDEAKSILAQWRKKDR